MIGNPGIREALTYGATGLCFLSCLLFSGASQAKEKNVTVSLTTEVLYTDNAGLRSNNQESEVVPKIRPGITIKEKGGRISTSIDYAPEIRFYLQGTGKETLKHFLNATASAEVAPQRLFLDATAAITQSAISSEQPVDLRGISSNNVTDSTRYSLSPYFTTAFGNFANFTARYTVDRVEYSNVATSDSYSHTFDVNLRSKGRGASWKIWYKQKLIKYDQNRQSSDYDQNRKDNRIKKGAMELGFPINRAWTLDGLLGYEENDSTTLNRNSRPNWRLGLFWKPSPRGQLKFGIEDDYSGNGYYLNLSYKRKRARITLSHDRHLSSTRQALATQQIFNQLDALGQPIESPAADGAVLDAGTATIDNSYYVQQSSRASMALSGMRTTGTFGLTRTQRDYQDGERNTLDWNLNASVTQRLSAFSRASARLGWRDHGGANDYEERTLTLTFNRRLSKSANTGLEIVGVSRTGSDDLNTYDENRVRTYFNVRW